MNYSDYLKLDQLLSCQNRVSVEKNRPAHDEMLFITTHQAYEIWFKQLLFELDSALSIFSQNKVSEADMGTLVSRLQRMVEISKLLVQQVDILETMTPLDFLEFRDLLYPASGFQSLQFRLLENKLGLKKETRLQHNHSNYDLELKPSERKTAQASENEVNLFSAIEKWLERTPFLKMEGFEFWKSYKKSVSQMFEEDKKRIESDQRLSEDEKSQYTKMVEGSIAAFEALFDENKYQELQKEGAWKLSYPSVHAALLIQLYRDQPIFQLPFRLITSVMDLENTLTQWRYRHALLAGRMIGKKVGTGGSSGARYLQSAAEKHRVFGDFFQLTTFFIPRSQLPELPASLKKNMDFYFNA